MSSIDPSLQSFVRKVHAMMIYRTLLKWSVGWLMILGVAVLVTRFTGELPTNWWQWMLVSWTALACIAWYRESLRQPESKQLRAAFDRQNQAGGLVMAAAEVDTRSWEAKAGSFMLPSVQWNSGRVWAGILLATVFLISTLLVPVKYASLFSDPPLEISQQVDQLHEQIDVLESEYILPENEAEAKREELDRIAEQASGFNPSKTWEALDQLLHTNEQLAQEEAEDALSKLKAINEATLLGKALEMLPKGLKDQKAMEEGLKQMGNLMQQLAKAGALDPENLPPELKKAMAEAMKQLAKGDGPDAQQLKQLLEALENNQDQLKDLAKLLGQKGLIPPNLADQFKPGQGGIDPGPLAELLRQHQGDFQELLQELGGELGGNGGINRGQGHAPLLYGNNSSEEGSEFKEQKLGLSVPLEQAKLAGVTITTPKVTGGEAILGKGALNTAQAGGGNALSAPVLPRHRGAVQRFFQRPGINPTGNKD
jgi:hypothetical protein